MIQISNLVAIFCDEKNISEPQKPWHLREVEKFMDGSYSLPYWSINYEYCQGLWHSNKNHAETRFHYCHVSKDNGASIAYTVDDEKGEADRQQRVRPGKYLTAYFNLCESFQRELITEHNAYYSIAQTELSIAKEPKEIAQVYMNGPSSCMSHTLDSFSTASTHPTEAYGAGDIGVAHVRNSNNRIIARTLVTLEDKVHSTIYGDGTLIKHALEREGYKEDSGEDFHEAKLLRIPLLSPQQIVMPYVDNDYGVGPAAGGFMELRKRDGDNQFYWPHNTNGRLEINTCHRCEGALEVSQTLNTTLSGHWHCNECAEALMVQCKMCNQPYVGPDGITLRVAPMGFEQTICPGCYRNLSRCAACGHFSSESSIHGASRYCPDHLPQPSFQFEEHAA